MLKISLLVLTVAGLHAAPRVPLQNDILKQGPPETSQKKIIEHSKAHGSSIDYRRQGTQPSRAILVDMISGLPRIPASEMERNYRTIDLNKASIDLFRQGTQPSRAVLVDLNTGLPRLPLSEMDRTYVLSGHKNEGEHLEITELKAPALIKGLHAAPSVPVRNYILNQGPPMSSQTKIIEHPKPNGSSIDYRKQGTQPSQAILVDMMSGLPRIPASEMERNYRTTESERCQGQVIDGKCYQFFASPRTFSEAESTCRELFPGGHLASVTSPALHSHLISLVINTNGGPALTWLGAFNFNHLNNGQFVWTDDSAWDYTAWLPGQPHIQGKENCLEMFKMDVELWSVVDCGMRRAFICSYSVTV
ncbi:uncharacterized protein [Lepisosteus oculatus]